jgi:dipeptidyl-peptidase-4
MKKLLLGLVVLFPIISIGQNKKDLTLEDAVIGRWTNLAPERIDFFSWIPNQDAYYIYGKVDDNVLYEASAPKFEEKPVISRSNVNALIKTLSDDTLRSLSGIEALGENKIKFRTKSSYYTLDLSTKNLKKGFDVNPDAANTEWSPTHDKLAYTIDNNLRVKTAGEEIKISWEENEDIVFGQAVHRFEFGVSKGTFWSPKGNLLAFYRNDQTMVTNYPLVDVSERPAKVQNVKYPMAGMKSEEVTLGVYNFKNKKTIYLNTGEPKEQYLTNIAWSPDEKYIYVAVLNRDQNHVKFNRYNVNDGSFDKTLFEEKHPKYVQPLNPILFLPKDDEKFIWQSQKDGFNHLYLYNTDGKFLQQLTSGAELVTQVLGFDASGNKLLVQTTAEFGLSRILKWVDIKTGNSSVITKQMGTTSAKASTNGNFIYTAFTDLKTPSDYNIINQTGGKVKNLLTPANPLDDYKVGATEVFQIKNKDGLDLNCRMVKPFDFDNKKKYPVLVYVYNGPNVQLIQNRYLAGASLWMHYFANKGYLVFTVDGRGSANKGFEFENAIFRNCGEPEMEDQISGVNYLKTLAYVDTAKFAVHGWSYGGFMTTSLMLKTPGVFDVGVSGGGVMDWKYYEVMYTERYMDTPETNPEGYEKTSLLNKTQNLKGKLLMIHDSGDDTVVPQHAEDFLKNCVKTGTQVDYFYYVGHPHNVRGKDRIHLMEKVLNYVEENLND